MSPSEYKKQGLSEVTEMFGEYYTDYASYVIMDRAVPYLADGLKPVQRRILHSLWEKDDGRYNKVANIIGHTMAYHPHGDQSIGDALIQMGQKNLLIDTQGNWGNVLTGDSAAAPRYIECRLTPFAKEVVFNKKTTHWDRSYDGRNWEPISLPVKFPMALAVGVEGIAVGMACKILPHNFIELIDCSIAALRGEEFELYPDFITGGFADCTDYRGGLQGGRVKVRAKIEKGSRKSVLHVRELPYGTTTTSLISNIVTANERNKIKIAKVEDLTASEVDIKITLPPGADPDATIDALYAFTDCEISVSTNASVIEDGAPQFLTVNEILIRSAEHTRDLLQWELEIRRDELEEEWQRKSLEKIYIENELYDLLKACKTTEDAHRVLREALLPLIADIKLFRELSDEDIERLLDVQTRRIIKHNADEADKKLREIKKELKDVRKNLRHLTDYAIAYFERIKDKYGKGRERRTVLTHFERVDAKQVAVASETLYLDRREGFIGTGLKRDNEVLGKCSKIDDLIVFRPNGTMMVTRVDSKVFIGKNPLYAGIYHKDDPTIFNMIYTDKTTGRTYAKRFQVGGVTRDRNYELVVDPKKTKVHYFMPQADENEPAPVAYVRLHPMPRLRRDLIVFEFQNLAIKGRGSRGNMLTKKAVKTVTRNRPSDAPLPTQQELRI